MSAPQMSPSDLCPACGGDGLRTLFQASDRLYHTTKQSFEVVECTACRLMRLFPQPKPAELERYYPRTYWYSAGPESIVARWEEAYRRMVLMDHVWFVEKAIAASESLDVGCGGGLFLRLLRERGHRVLGLDFSLEAAVVAKTLNRVPVVCATLSKAPLPPGQFSVLTMFHVLEHLYDPAGYVEAAHALLGPGGRLVVQVPNAASWQFLLFGQNWNGLDVPRHLVNFKAKDLVTLLETTGFEVVRRKFFSLRDNPAGMATSIATSLDPMARRVRETAESGGTRLVKDAAYLALTLACLPFTIVEAACCAGSTIMIEARKRA